MGSCFLCFIPLTSRHSDLWPLARFSFLDGSFLIHESTLQSGMRHVMRGTLSSRLVEKKKKKKSRRWINQFRAWITNYMNVAGLLPNISSKHTGHSSILCSLRLQKTRRIPILRLWQNNALFSRVHLLIAAQLPSHWNTSSCSFVLCSKAWRVHQLDKSAEQRPLFPQVKETTWTDLTPARCLLSRQ